MSEVYKRYVEVSVVESRGGGFGVGVVSGDDWDGGDEVGKEEQESWQGS